MKDYVAWMAYEDKAEHALSVCRGTLRQCMDKALEVHKSDDWQYWSEGKATRVRITRGPKQLFVKAYFLTN